MASAKRSSGAASRIACLWCVCALASCAVGPDFHRPDAPTDAQYAPDIGPIAAGNTGDSLFVEGRVPARWWHLLGAPELDALVDEALRHNASIEAAEATLRQSLDARRAGDGLFMPQVGMDAGALRERAAPLRLGSAQPSSIFNVFTLSGSVGYVLDVFGTQRRRYELLGAEADEARENARATYLAVTSNVVATAIARAAYAAEAATVQELLDAADTQTVLARARFEAGTGAYADVAALIADAAALRATLPPIRAREEAATHLLAVLCGHTPGAWQVPPVPFASYSIAGALPVEVPSALARQRPDIRAAEARLHQASANVGIATADMFPSIILSGSLGSATNALATLTPAQGRFWSGGADVSIPVFQGGTLFFQRKAAQEAYRASAASYRQVVLVGLQQVADSLAVLDADATAVNAQAQAEHAASESLQIGQANCAAGLADYSTFLTAVRSDRTARLATLQAQAQQLQDVVALYVALGGDWQSAEVAAHGHQ